MPCARLCVRRHSYSLGEIFGALFTKLTNEQFHGPPSNPGGSIGYFQRSNSGGGATNIDHTKNYAPRVRTKNYDREGQPMLLQNSSFATKNYTAHGTALTIKTPSTRVSRAKNSTSEKFPNLQTSRADFRVNESRSSNMCMYAVFAFISL